jgi:hypothetical protein
MKKKRISIAFELALEPVAIKAVLPEQTLAVCSGMILLCTLKRLDW